MFMVDKTADGFGEDAVLGSITRFQKVTQILL